VHDHVGALGVHLRPQVVHVVHSVTSLPRSAGARRADAHWPLVRPIRARAGRTVEGD
jgi:hypothetical protein